MYGPRIRLRVGGKEQTPPTFYQGKVAGEWAVSFGVVPEAIVYE